MDGSVPEVISAENSPAYDSGEPAEADSVWLPGAAESVAGCEAGEMDCEAAEAGEAGEVVGASGNCRASPGPNGDLATQAAGDRSELVAGGGEVSGGGSQVLRPGVD